MFAELILSLARWVRIGVRPASSNGIQIFRRTFYRLSSSSISWQALRLGRGDAAAQYVRTIGPKTLIDVGAGGLHHSRAFAKAGIRTTAVDLGSSVYAAEREKKSNNLPLVVIDADFLELKLTEKFDVLFCSHTLEHQQNVGQFLRKCIDSVAEGGLLVFVLPFPHWDLQGGHVAQFSPKSVIYALALAGLDCSESKVFDSHGEFTVVVRKLGEFQPNVRSLTFDKGDIEKLADKLPSEIREGSSAYKSWSTLEP